MTIIAGLLAKDGVVIAADSQATDSQAGIRTSYDQKLRALGNQYVWGLSGGVGLAQYLRPALEQAHRGNWPQKPLLEVRTAIGATIASVRRELVEKQLVSNTIPGAEVLVAGFSQVGGQMKPWLIEFPTDNMSQEHERFCAVGSGKKAGYHAFESIRHYSPADRDVTLATLFLYRIMVDAIRAESQGVGGAIHLWVVTGGNCQQLPESELDGLQQLLEQWQEAERKSLIGLIAAPEQVATMEAASHESDSTVDADVATAADRSDDDAGGMPDNKAETSR